MVAFRAFAFCALLLWCTPSCSRRVGHNHVEQQYETNDNAGKPKTGVSRQARKAAFQKARNAALLFGLIVSSSMTGGFQPETAPAASGPHPQAWKSSNDMVPQRRNPRPALASRSFMDGTEKNVTEKFDAPLHLNITEQPELRRNLSRRALLTAGLLGLAGWPVPVANANEERYGRGMRRGLSRGLVPDKQVEQDNGLRGRMLSEAAQAILEQAEAELTDEERSEIIEGLRSLKVYGSDEERSEIDEVVDRLDIDRISDAEKVIDRLDAAELMHMHQSQSVIDRLDANPIINSDIDPLDLADAEDLQEALRALGFNPSKVDIKKAIQKIKQGGYPIRSRDIRKTIKNIWNIDTPIRNRDPNLNPFQLREGDSDIEIGLG